MRTLPEHQTGSDMSNRITRLVIAVAAMVATPMMSRAQTSGTTFDAKTMKRLTASVDGQPLGTVVSVQNFSTQVQSLQSTTGTIGTTTAPKSVTMTLSAPLASGLKAWYDAAVVTKTAGARQKTLTITAFDATSKPVITWQFDDAWPAKVVIVSKTTTTVVQNVKFEFKDLRVLR